MTTQMRIVMRLKRPSAGTKKRKWNRRQLKIMSLQRPWVRCLSSASTLSARQIHVVGSLRIAGSSVRVKDVVIWHDRQGMAPADIVSNWPHLTLASIYAALAYYHDHREEINAEIAADQSWYEEQKAKSPSLLQEKLRRLKATDTDVADDSLSS